MQSLSRTLRPLPQTYRDGVREPVTELASKKNDLTPVVAFMGKEVREEGHDVR